MRAWFCLILSLPLILSAGETAPDLVVKAQAAVNSGKLDDALPLIAKAIEADAKYWPAYLFRARLYAERGEMEKVGPDFDKVIELNPDATPKVYSERGSLYFKAGKIKESLADFDALVKLRPESEPHLWQRGIVQYYAGKYEDGRKQFVVHQTVNGNDVENAAWHFLCNARANGIERARKEIIPIDGDSRVPMAEVHRLFKGELKVEDVLAAAAAGNPSPENLKRHLFYAHLYIGLYYEALGETEKAKEYILKAAPGYGQDDYMTAVAKVHAAQFKK